MASSTTKQRLWLLARIGFPVLAFAYLFGRLDRNMMLGSVERITWVGALGCLFGQAVAVFTGLVRWRCLMRAYAARALPSWLDSARLFLVGAFYNLLPGAVGGDFLRAYATGPQFVPGGVTASLGVVFVERVVGLAALLALSAACTVLSPKLSGPVLAYALMGLLAAAFAIGGIAAARRLAPLLPGRIGSFFSSLPSLSSPAPFALAAIISVGTHLSIALGGFALIHSLDPSVSLSDALVIFPIGTMAAFFPATVAGAGARDFALVLLFERIGVSNADALTTSIAMLAANLAVSGIGGVIHVFWSPGVEVPSDVREGGSP